jgi:hypothetical protein
VAICNLLFLLEGELCESALSGTAKPLRFNLFFPKIQILPSPIRRSRLDINQAPAAMICAVINHALAAVAPTQATRLSDCRQRCVHFRMTFDFDIVSAMPSPQHIFHVLIRSKAVPIEGTDNYPSLFRLS